MYADENLLADFINGKRKAFDELYDHYYSSLVRFCYSFTKNLEEAKDITIVTLTVLFRKNKDFKSLSAIKGFLYTTARNNSLNHIKYVNRRKRHHTKYTESVPVEAQVVFLDIVEDELFRLLQKSIQALPPQCQ